jgi:predicted DNA-binding ribbon-helix-helix protein
MKSSVIKRSIVIAGRKTSVSLEEPFWKAFREIADGRHMRLSELAAAINSDRQHSNLSSAIRLFVLGFYRDQLISHDQISNGQDSEGRWLPIAVAR